MKNSNLKKDKLIEKFDRRLSLESLENDYWKENPHSLTAGLIEKCHRYRKIPIQNLTVEQVRILIGQQIGLDYLLPIAFEFLEEDILSHGDFYEGDLLASIFRTNQNYWASRPLFHKKILELLENGKEKLDTEYVDKDLKKKIEIFKIHKH